MSRQNWEVTDFLFYGKEINRRKGITICEMPVITEILDLGRAYAAGLGRLRQAAIDKGLAQFNPKTGAWEWKDEE